MPSYSTHYIFANSLLERIKKADPTIKLNASALYYGTQGPDLLFTHRLLPTMKGKSLRPLGSLFHHCDIAMLFHYMGEYLSTAPCDKDIVKSYIYGFICHFSLDRITHPYIYATQKRMTELYGYGKYPSLVVHNMIEYNIDMLLLRDFTKQEDSRLFNTQETLLKDDRLISEMAKLLTYSMSKLSDVPVDFYDFRNAFYDMRQIQGLLCDPTGIKNAVVSLVQLPVKPFLGPIATSFLRRKKSDCRWDYLNVSHMGWVPPAKPREISHKGFMELFGEAQEDALNIISKFDEATYGRESFGELTENMSFDTGARFDVHVELH